MTTPPDPTIAPAAAAAPVRVHLLGRFAVEVDGKPLRFPRRAPQKPLELLKTLVALGGESVAAETLGDALWPEAEGDQAANALHTTLSRLRQLIGADAVTLQNGRFWIALVAPRNPLVDERAGKPLLRKVLQRLPAYLRPKAKNSMRGHVIAVDADGRVVVDLQDPKAAYPVNTSATETAAHLYVGSLVTPVLARLDKAAVGL